MTSNRLIWSCAVLALFAGGWVARGEERTMPRIGLSEDGRAFVKEATGERFNPWGFNYDHRNDGLENLLLEDYWHDRWDLVVEDFHKMKALGANSVRIHLQFNRFMKSPAEPNESELRQLRRLLQLAEEAGLYINLTGLGCYHKADTPSWYDEMTEQERWAAQARFWEAVARACAGSPAVFCYNLMNEPVAPGGDGRRDDWLGPGFAGRHFVQFISLDRAGRDRSEIARAWIRRLVEAIRPHDPKRLITVGLVHWSLDRPGLTSGFVPEKIAPDLDFIAMHIYPETGKVDAALETVGGFDVGKPLVIEETYVLRCDIDDLAKFLRESRRTATGWFGFFWGRAPEELNPPRTIGEAMLKQWLEFFQENAETFKDGRLP